jgi:hypothetical protein
LRSVTRKKIRKLGPCSRVESLGNLDQRTRSAAYLRRVRAELVEHVGGAPDAVQKLLIDRLAVIALRLKLYDEAFAEGKRVTEFDNRTYGALHSQYRLMLAQLGPAAAARAPTLAEIIRENEARGVAA